MKTLGTLLSGLGAAIVVVMGLYRRIGVPDLQAIGIGPGAILPVMLLGGVICGLGYLLMRRADEG